MSAALDINAEVADALRAGRPVVALESTLIAHGLPWPLNRDTALEAEAVVRAEGAIPATIAVWRGRPTVGLDANQIERLGTSKDVRKASRRDLGTALSQGATAATTVAATMFLAHHAGIRVFATGGIGGVHRHSTWDVSADLHELARTPVAVICAGAKSILDLTATLEVLETLGVPVVGYGTATFPAFYVRSSGLPVTARVDTPEAASQLLGAHWELSGAGVVVAQPIAEEVAIDPAEFEVALEQAERTATDAGVSGPALTPFLLARLAELTDGRTLRTNRTLIVANARLAARIARSLSGASSET